METAKVRYRKHLNRKAIFYTIKVVAIFILFFFAVIMLFPYLYMVLTSFKSQNEIVNYSSIIYFYVKEFTPSNYIVIFEKIPLLRGFMNTIILEVFVLTIGTFTTTLAAYAFSRIDFYGKNVIFYILLSSMMIPYITVLVPQYSFWLKFMDGQFYGTLVPLIAPSIFGNVAMMFFMKQYADTIPTEVYEAAEINGAGFWTTYTKLFLPLVRPAILAQVIFWFLGIWNDFFGPDIYLPNLENKTLQIMIRYFDNNTGGGTGGSLLYQPYTMAASVLSSIPTLVVYIIFQKYFVKTFMFSGSKR